MCDVDSVMISLHRERFTLRTDGTSRPIPEWADWLIWLGAWMRSQAVLDGRRVAVALSPTRRLAAAFVGLGALLAASRLHNDSLDWDSLQTLPSGALVHWRDLKGPKSVRYAGLVDGIREIDGSQFLAISVQSPARAKGTVYLPRASALKYGVTRGAITNRTEGALAKATSIFNAVVDDSSVAWARSPTADSTLITERSTFLADLDGLLLEAPGTEALTLGEALSITDLESRQHGKLRLVPVREHGGEDIARGLTILDGARAARWLDQASARSVVLLLDHAEYDEEIANLLDRYLAYSGDEGVHAGNGGGSILRPPASIEALVFGLPESREAPRAGGKA